MWQGQAPNTTFRYRGCSPQTRVTGTLTTQFACNGGRPDYPLRTLLVVLSDREAIYVYGPDITAQRQAQTQSTNFSRIWFVA